jgi:hypothetical protein
MERRQNLTSARGPIFEFQIFDPYTIIFVSSLLAILAALFVYSYFIYQRHKAAFAGATFVDRLLSAFSHVDDPNSGPLAHIFAGILLLIGLASLVSAITLLLIRPLNFDLSVTLSVFSAVTVIFFGTMDIWNLWQTKRLFFRQGYVVPDFKALIVQITDEINVMRKSIALDYNGIPQQHHRIIGISPQFYFGMLSYPNSDEELNYRNALTNVCSIKASASGRSLPITIACGDVETINDWHKRFYLGDPDFANKCSKANEKFERLIEDMAFAADVKNDTLFTRIKGIPSVQFLIVGNKLFEFTMNSGDHKTEIYNTQVLSDSRQCAAYIKQLEFILSLHKRAA